MSTPAIVDLFAGPGGLDVGAQLLGVPSVGIEFDASACATRRAAGLATVHGDVRDFGPADFPEATVLTGGPPCQTFTVAGAGSGRAAMAQVLALVSAASAGADISAALAGLADARTGLVLEPLRWALAAEAMGRPYESIVLEQVPQALPVWQAYSAALSAHGYQVSTGVLQSEMFGVPQTRRRAVLVARLGHEVALPQPTHQGYHCNGIKAATAHLRELVTMAQALRDTRHTGFTVVSNYGTSGDPRKRGTRRCTQPSSTVTGKIMRNRVLCDDGSEDRFSYSEAGVLQGFPSDFPWTGPGINQQIGNAIPPRLAAHVLAAACGIDPAPIDVCTVGAGELVAGAV